MPTESGLLVTAYLETYLFAIALLILILFQANRSEYGRDRLGRGLFNFLVVSVIVAMAADAFAWWLNGRTFDGAAILNAGATFVSFATIPLPFMVWLVYTDYRLFADTARLRRHLPLYLGFFAANVVLCIINIWSGWYFTFDEHNLYQRGALMPLSFIFGFLYLIWTGGLAFSKIGNPDITKEERQLCRYHLFFIVPPLVAGALQLAFYGISVAWVATTFSVIFYYVNDQLFQLRKIQKLENDLMQSKISVMLSQIQPHFLYNALVVIKQLCDVDPPKAKEAVVEFSHYLRANLDSLTLQGGIPFSSELGHIENYLALEQKRFDDRVRVEYDIGYSDFLVPALTVQPLVENAVRYGIVRKEGGGTVSIRTRLEDHHVVIEVEDDGIGFDPSQPLDENRSHIGIENIHNRLASLYEGSLQVESAVGEGTKVTIRIPVRK